MSWITRMLEDTTLSESIRLELQREYAQLELDEMDEKYDKMREKNELYVNMVTDIASSLGSAMADVLSNEEDAMKNLLKQMLLSAVSAIEAYVRLAYVKVITEGILTGGISLGKGLLQIAAIETSFAVVKGLIGNFYTGGFTSSGAWDKPQGIVHSNEFVANRFAVGNSEILPVLKLIDTAQKNNTVGSLTSQDVSGVLRVGGQNQSAAVEVIQTTDPETKRLIAECTTVMQTITKRFEKRIIAETYITGKGGINEALSDYDKLMKNVKR